MRKSILWITAILLFLTGAIGCQKTVPQPVTATDAPTASATAPNMTDAPIEPAPTASTGANPDEAQLYDPSYREMYVTFPSRGVQVHATVVLPGHTTVADEPIASETPSDAPAASPAAEMPSASDQPDPSAQPDASAQPDNSAKPDASANASDAPATSPDASPDPDNQTLRDMAREAGSPAPTEGTAGVMPISGSVTANSGESAASGYPLVVFLHGHGGERNENGGFTEIARQLAARGIASVRFDFAGSGESEEAFTENSITTMKTDVLAAIDFVKSTYPIDETRIGVFGFDMGGRVALQVLAENLYDFRAAVLLAPANRNDDWITLFGGQTEWDRYKTDAELNNHTTFTTLFGQVQDLSIRWFTDLEMTDDPATAVGQTLSGRVLVIYAQNDTTVPPETPRRVAETLGAQTVELETGGHSYGFYAENGELLNRIASEAADFFAVKLNAQPAGR